MSTEKETELDKCPANQAKEQKTYQA